jgi:hypothetical protein
MSSRPPHTYVVGPSNWTSLADGSGSGSNNIAQSNYVGFRISSDGGLSFGSNSNGVDGGARGHGNCMDGGIGSGVGVSGHEWFFADKGSGHGSSPPTKDITKPFSQI